MSLTCQFAIDPGGATVTVHRRIATVRKPPRSAGPAVMRGVRLQY
jgi:hypothetical protein